MKKFITFISSFAFIVLGREAAHAALIHQWTFNDGTANDLIGSADGVLFNGATIGQGSLRLDGVNDYMRTSVTDNTVTSKTLLVWATLDNLTQGGGGLLTIEDSRAIDIFDSIVYGERVPNQWMAGSNMFTRTPINNGGALETEISEILIAITYSLDNSINIYRNSELYASYTKGTLQPFTGGLTDFLLGLRHIECVQGGPCGSGGAARAFFAGSINEARVYNTDLSASQIQTIFEEGPVTQSVPESSTITIVNLFVILGLAKLLHKKGNKS